MKGSNVTSDKNVDGGHKSVPLLYCPPGSGDQSAINFVGGVFILVNNTQHPVCDIYRSAYSHLQLWVSAQYPITVSSTLQNFKSYNPWGDSDPVVNITMSVNHSG